MKFLLGLAVGVALALAAPAIAATVTGFDSALVGWQVVKGGQTVCANPWADVVHSRIDCDG
jgi:hypothetical protein